MNKTYTLREDEIGGGLYRRIYLLVRKNRWTRQAIGATTGLAGGMLSIILGALLWAVVVSLPAPGSFRSFLNVLEIVLFALSLPLLALGASCLDLLEKKPPILPLPAKSQPAGCERLIPFDHNPHRN